MTEYQTMIIYATMLGTFFVIGVLVELISRSRARKQATLAGCHFGQIEGVPYGRSSNMLPDAKSEPTAPKMCEYALPRRYIRQYESDEYKRLLEDRANLSVAQVDGYERIGRPVGHWLEDGFKDRTCGGIQLNVLHKLHRDEERRATVIHSSVVVFGQEYGIENHVTDYLNKSTDADYIAFAMRRNEDAIRRKIMFGKPHDPYKGWVKLSEDREHRIHRMGSRDREIMNVHTMYEKVNECKL